MALWSQETVALYQRKRQAMRSGKALAPDEIITDEDRAVWSAYIRDWYAKNREKTRARAREVFAEKYANDPVFREKHLRAGRETHRRRGEKVYARQKQYETVEHPFSRTVRASNSRAKKWNSSGKLVLAEVEAWAASREPGCAYCGHVPAFSLDHVIPLSRGGLNVMENIVTCCGWCNSSKGNRNSENFVPPALTINRNK